MAKTTKTNFTTVKEPYINMPKRTLRSKEYITLSPTANKIYTVFLCEFKHDQPDKEIKLSYSKITEYSNVKGRTTISKALRELIEKEFIFKTTKGGLERNVNGYKMNKKWILLENRRSLPKK